MTPGEVPNSDNLKLFGKLMGIITPVLVAGGAWVHFAVMAGVS